MSNNLNTLFQEEAYTLKHAFEARGLNLQVTHAHELIAGYLGFNSKKGLIQYCEDNEIQLNRDWLPFTPSKRHLISAISRLKTSVLENIEVDDIALMISNSLDYKTLYLLDDEGIRYINSPYLNIEIDEYRALIATYRDDFHDIDYVRNVLRQESFEIDKLAMLDEVKNHLETYNLRDSREDPFAIIIDGETFYTDDLKHRELLESVFNQ